MRIVYNANIDLLYMRLDEQQQDVINKQVAEGFMLDLGKGNKIIGIEILDASRRLNLKNIMPVKYEVINTPKQVRK